VLAPDRLHNAREHQLAILRQEVGVSLEQHLPQHGRAEIPQLDVGPHRHAAPTQLTRERVQKTLVGGRVHRRCYLLAGSHEHPVLDHGDAQIRGEACHRLRARGGSRRLPDGRQQQVDETDRQPLLPQVDDADRWMAARVAGLAGVRQRGRPGANRPPLAPRVVDAVHGHAGWRCPSELDGGWRRLMPPADRPGYPDVRRLEVQVRTQPRDA
jgi:hypothetical protein